MNTEKHTVNIFLAIVLLLTSFCVRAIEEVDAVKKITAPTTRFYVWASTAPLSYLTDANVTIQDAKGNLIARGKTNHRGMTKFKLPNRKLRHLPLRIQTSGGKVGGQPFHGRLKALSYDVGERKPIIHLDLVSTTAMQMKKPQLTYAEATEAVRHTLSIINRAAIDVLRVKNPYVDADRLELAIKTAGGYERFVRVLAQAAKQGIIMDDLKPHAAHIKTRNQSASERILQDALNPNTSSRELVTATSSSTNTSTLCTTATPDNGNTVANYGYIATASLLEFVGVPLSATEGVTGMLLASVGVNDTSPTTEALTNIANELDCISSQLTYIEDEEQEIITLIEENELQTELTNANECANDLTTGWNYYQALANGTDGSIDTANVDLCGWNGSNCGSSSDMAYWQSELETCSTSINNALFATAGNPGGSAWAELNILTQGQYAWYTQAQTQALQSFLSYWSTMMYQQFVLQNEVFNFYGEWGNAITFSGGPGTSGSTACAYGIPAGGATACQWQSNVQFAFPPNLYSDEIGLWDGTAINAYPAGLTLGGDLKSATGYNVGYIANGGYEAHGLGTWSYSSTSSTLASNAQTAFNGQGINPLNSPSGIETYENPQALRTLSITSSQLSALQTPLTCSTDYPCSPTQDTGTLSASQFFYAAINQVNDTWPSSNYSYDDIGYYASDDTTSVSGVQQSGADAEAWEDITVNLSAITIPPSPSSALVLCAGEDTSCNYEQTVSPILAVLMGRTWWSGANNATNTNFYLLLPAPQTVPNAPSLTSLTPGNGTIQVAFDSVDASEDGGSSITGYIASCTTGTGTAAITTTTSGTESPLIVQGLIGGSQYTCSIQAQNAGGFSAIPTTCPIASCTATPSAANVPSAPQSLAAWTGYLEVSLTFDAPTSDGGSPIIGYQATCTNPQTGAIAGAISGTSSPLVVTGLTGGTTYSCSVVAQNSAGNSQASTTNATASYMTVPTLTSLYIYNVEGEAEFLLGFTGSTDMGETTISTYSAICVSTNAPTQQIVVTSATVATLMENGTYVAPNSFTMPMTGEAGTGGYTYECVVQAEDSNGEYSPLSNVLTAASQAL